MLDHPTSGDDVLVAVEAHLLSVLGGDSGRGSVTFLGVDRLDVLRFGPDGDGRTHYATVGVSRRPMADPAELIADPIAGPRAELVLTTSASGDDVLRPLAMLAATPAVEGLVLSAGVILRLPDDSGIADQHAFRLGEPKLVPDLDLGQGRDPVRFLELEPF
jgi:hypothetical protein